MKKFILLSIIIVSLFFTFVACDLNDGEIRTTITEKEWEAIDNITNYTLNISISSDREDGGKSHQVNAIKSTDTARYSKSSSSQYATLSDVSYYVITEGQRYVINHWNKQAHQWDKDVWYADKADWWKPKSIYDELSWVDLEYKDLVYNKEEKAYVYTLKENELIGIISYYFEDGNLVRATAYVYQAEKIEEIDESNCVEEVVATISSIGTTEVEVPEYIIVE